MARGRMIGKVIILSKKINAVSEGAENLYYRIYVKTDDFGQFHADPTILKGQVYTLRNISVATIKKRLIELINIGLIKTYEVNGEWYIKIVGFEKHQHFRKDYTLKREYPKPGTKSYEAVQPRTEPRSNINEINSIQVKLKKERRRKVNINAEQEMQIAKLLKTVKGIGGKKWGEIIQYLRELSIEFPDIDYVEQMKKKVAWWLDNPLTNKSNIHLQLRNWFIIAQKGIDEAKKQHQVGAPRGKFKTKYPTLFLGNVYALLRKQGKDGNKYASLFFALTDEQAKVAAEKYKDNPAGFIKMLEENA